MNYFYILLDSAACHGVLRRVTASLWKLRLKHWPLWSKFTWNLGRRFESQTLLVFFSLFRCSNYLKTLSDNQSWPILAYETIKSKFWKKWGEGLIHTVLVGKESDFLGSISIKVWNRMRPQVQNLGWSSWLVGKKSDFFGSISIKVWNRMRPQVYRLGSSSWLVGKKSDFFGSSSIRAGKKMRSYDFPVSRS